MTKQETKKLYGIAILMMLFHHLFRTEYSGNYVSILNNIFGTNILLEIARVFKLCVSIYAFITGYGFCEATKQEELILKNDGIVYSFRFIKMHILKIYKKFWIVFLIFIPIGYVERIYSDYNINTVFFSFVGLDYSYNGTWWYVWQYVIFCVSFPIIWAVFILFSRYKDRFKLVVKDVVAIFVVFGMLSFCCWMLCGYSKDIVIYEIVFLVGYTASYFDFVYKGRQYLMCRKANSAICLFLLFVIIIFRLIMQGIGISGVADVLIILPFVVVMCELNTHLYGLSKLLNVMGGINIYVASA